LVVNPWLNRIDRFAFLVHRGAVYRSTGVCAGNNREWNGARMVQVENKTQQWFGASLDASSNAHSTAIVVVRSTINTPGPSLISPHPISPHLQSTKGGSSAGRQGGVQVRGRAPASPQMKFSFTVKLDVWDESSLNICMLVLSKTNI